MNPYDYYITPEEYNAAAENGISRATLSRRVREMAWSKERAINTPPQKRTDRKRWSEIASRNGIEYALFHLRIRKGWTEERAATQPRATEETIRKNALRATEYTRKYPREYVELANQNGIPYATFSWRVVRGWGYERAATEHLVSRKECGRRGKRKSIQIVGDLNSLVFGKKG